jgi:GT2 family glycosyltransferase
MENDFPLVTVNILSFNRRDELRNTLTKVFAQDYKNIEVIVVDNASSDGSVEMVTEQFPVVRLIRLKKNIGIAGWNEGFKNANGEFILVLDDDSYPMKNSILNAIECRRKQNSGIVCFKVNNLAENRSETDHINKQNPNTFIGCGALIEKQIFEKIGYFSEILFLYEHETEFSMRALNHGISLKFCKDAEVIHVGSISNRIIKHRKDKRRKFYLCRNYLIILLLHFSVFNILIFLPQLIFAKLCMAVIERNFLSALSGFTNALVSIPIILRNRVELDTEVQKIFKNGNYMGRFVKDKVYSSI